MLRAEPRNWYSWDFTVLDDGLPVADVDVSAWRERGTVEIAGVRCEVYREGWAGDFVLEADGHVLVRATKPSAFFRRFDVTIDGATYTLEAQSALRRSFLLHRDGDVLGTLVPESAFTRKMRIDLPETLPLAVRVFLAWLVVLMWKRAAQSN